MMIFRSSPNDGQKRMKQFHKERHVVKHVDTSSNNQNGNNMTFYSGTMSQQDGQPICSTSIPPQPLHGSISFQGYRAMNTPPVPPVNPSTVQNYFGGPFPMPVLTTMPSTLQYPPVHPPPHVLAQPPVIPHPPGIPFHYTSQNCYPSSSSGLTLSPSAQLQPPATLPIVSEFQQNYSYT